SASGTGSVIITGTSGASCVGNYAVSSGVGNEAPSYNEFSVGIYGTTYVGNPSAFTPTDRAFNVGIGSSSGARTDAFTVLKNGKIGIGHDNFEAFGNEALLSVNGTIRTLGYT